jgi:signal transduction histidine kinase
MPPGSSSVMNPDTGPAAYADASRTAVALACTLLLALLTVATDAVTRIELDVAAIYGLPLVLAVRTGSRLTLWALATVLIVAAFGVYAAQAPTGTFTVTDTFFVNRVLDAVAVILAAALLNVWMQSRSTLESRARLLAERNSELRRHQQQLARQNMELDRRCIEAGKASTRKTRLLAAVSHDIRTPVNTISIMADVIRRTAENPAHVAEVPQLAAQLQTSVRELSELVSVMLDTTHFESGHVACHESVFSVNEFLTSVCQDFLPVARAKAIRLQAEVCREELWVEADRIKLQRVMSNLVSNAIKFTESGGVTVSAEKSGDSLHIAVSDTGIGMSSSDLARVFDEFVQFGTSGNNARRGWGLGLAICRRLVDLAGGTISVESALNKGSVFTVQLPARCLMPAPHPRHFAPRPAPGAKRLPMEACPASAADLSAAPMASVDIHRLQFVK